MASEVPKPRSFQQILADIANTFRARSGIRRLKTGSSILTALEAAAQSDLRSTQDVFNALDLRDINRLSGSALDFAAKDDGVTRLAAIAATSVIDVFDPTINRISSKVYSGTIAPVAGSSTIRVVDATDFPSSGTVYIGRGTTNVEGPITYSAKTQFAGYWTITLSTPTARFHNINEDVVVGQKGDRSVSSGTSVSTQKDGRNQPIQYVTTSDATILDGEVATYSVPVVCQQNGTVGNVPKGSLTQFASAPFAGATCTNPSPIITGQDIESDDQLKQRLIYVRSSKSRGTAFAILSNAAGVFSSEENKRVVSTTIVQPANSPSTLFIDDGSGYEETTSGIPYEVLVDQASGGELYFSLSGRRPISKAFVKTTLSGPFSLESGAKLSVKVGGVTSEHSFSSDDFTAIGSALAVEVVSSINNNSALLFSARTAENGEKVSIFAKSETNEDIAVQAPSSGTDANTFLGFSTDTSYTLKLYKNDQLLYKDGQFAIINSAAQSSWSTIATGVKVNIAVDGTPGVDYTFTDADFVASNTGYTTVSKNNPISAWVVVFNQKIPGITASDGGGYLILTSNKGADSAASIVVGPPTSGSSLITAGMFTSTSGLSASGLNADYTLNRNTGQIKLFEALVAGDSLTVGSFNTRAHAQSSDFDGGSVTLTGVSKFWIAVDGATEIVRPATSSATTYSVNYSTGVYTFAPALSTNPLEAGDFAVIYDTALTAHGAFRVVGDSTTTFTLRHDVNATALVGVSLLNNGLIFARTNSYIQEVRLPSGNLTLDSIVSVLNEQLVGATASVFRGKSIRITSNSYRGGDIMIVGANQAGQTLGFTTQTLFSDSQPHIASLTATTNEVGVPEFTQVARVLTEATNQRFPQITSNAPVAALPVYPPTSFPITSRVEGGHPLFGLGFNQTGTLGYVNHFMGRHRELLSRETTPSSFNLRQKQSSSVRLQSGIAIGGLVRTGGTTVTATTLVTHGLTTGDVIIIGPTGTADANFVAGRYVVASAPTTSTFTYTNAGANVASTQPYGVNLWDDVEVNSGSNYDLFVPVNPYSIGPYDSLNVTMDNDSVTQNYSVPMYRNIKLSGTPSSTMSVKDADNSDLNLSVSFGTTEFFNDFWCYMQPKTVSHLGVANKDILWRFAKYGSQGDMWSIWYDYPSAASLPIDFSVENGTQLHLTMPSGTARGGLNLASNTSFTATNVASLGGRSVTLSYATVVISSIARVGSTVTVNTATNHGLAVGQIAYISGVPGVNFTAGPKIVVTTPLATQFTYTEAGAVDTQLAGAVSSSASGPNFGTVVINDIIHLDVNTVGWPYQGDFRVTAIPSATSVTFFVTDPTLTTALATPLSIGSTSAMAFYPINSATSTANDYITFAGSSLSSLVTAANYAGNGTGTITVSTADEYASGTVNYNATSVDRFSLRDGVNYVRLSDLTAGPNTIRFKQGVDGTYTSSWVDEPARLVPVSSEPISRWLTASAVTGLGQKADVLSTGPLGALQISSEKAGDLGGLDFTENDLNGQSVPVSGAGDTSLGKINFNKALESSLLPGSWVALENTDNTIQALPITGTDTIALASNGTVTFSVPLSVVTTIGPNIGLQTGVNKVGNFALYLHRAATSFNDEGDFLEVSFAGASAANNGIFRIVRSGTIATSAGTSIKYCWVENPNAVTETFAEQGGDVVRCYTATSIIPGDIFEIAYQLGSDQNIGQYEVTSTTINSGVFVVNGTFSPVSATAIGASNVNQLRLIRSPLRIIKRLVTIGIDPDSSIDPLLPGTDWAIFDSATLLSGISGTLGGFISPLGRFGFDTQPLVGANGYNVTTGLIGEVNKVLYGDLNSPSIYPGVVADGAALNISGPNLKRIQVSLQLRLRTGVTEETAIDRVRNAVTTAINSIPLGTSVDFARVVSAARGVYGVAAVSVLSPTFSASSDLIPVQSNEKPFVFNPDTDIQLAIVE